MIKKISSLLAILYISLLLISCSDQLNEDPGEKINYYDPSLWKRISLPGMTSVDEIVTVNNMLYLQDVFHKDGLVNFHFFSYDKKTDNFLQIEELNTTFEPGVASYRLFSQDNKLFCFFSEKSGDTTIRELKYLTNAYWNMFILPGSNWMEYNTLFDFYYNNEIAYTFIKDDVIGLTVKYNKDSGWRHIGSTNISSGLYYGYDYNLDSCILNNKIFISIQYESDTHDYYDHVTVKYNNTLETDATWNDTIPDELKNEYIRYTKIDSSENNVYLLVDSFTKLNVYKFNELTGWELFGNLDFGTSSLTSFLRFKVIDDDNLFVLYEDGKNSGRNNLVKYDTVSNTWKSLGLSGEVNTYGDIRDLIVTDDLTTFIHTTEGLYQYVGIYNKKGNK